MANQLLRSLLFKMLRAGFRSMPLSARHRDALRHRFFTRHPELLPSGPRGKVVGGTSRRPRDHSAHRLLCHVDRKPGVLPTPLPATVIAFYLPQFHPIQENDDWWGVGFTEWRNVSRALPQFEGHAQPRIPADLGYYDLRLPEVMREQATLAREYGISAFCTYFYWFAGKTLLEAPLRHWLNDPSIDISIALCWANENWSRRWDGRATDVLIAQAHSAEDDLAFIAYIAPYLRDPRYLRVDGKPVLAVYRPGLLPDAKATAERWRKWCRDNDVGELHLIYVQSFDSVDPDTIGFDAAASFPPNNTNLAPLTATQRLINPAYRGEVLDWRELANSAMSASDPAYRLYPGINPGWDNEPRRSGCGRTYRYASPRVFSSWARHAIETAQRRSPQTPLVFVNAWNEWAEGAVLEPDIRYGFAWLNAIRQALLPLPQPQKRPCAVIHVWYVELLEEIVVALAATGQPFRIVLTVAQEHEMAVRTEVARLALNAELIVLPNRGRDILPFLHAAGRLVEEGEDVVLKLHTKRSTHRQNGSAWRRELLQRLVAPSRAKAIIQAFAADASLGIVAPEGHVQNLGAYLGDNDADVAFLCSQMGIRPPDYSSDQFVAGSMFWCRLSALSLVLDAALSESDFQPEQGQIDGTMAHAVERCLNLASQSAGYRLQTAASIVGEPEPPSADYAYAAKG